MTTKKWADLISPGGHDADAITIDTNPTGTKTTIVIEHDRRKDSDIREI